MDDISSKHFYVFFWLVPIRSMTLVSDQSCSVSARIFSNCICLLVIPYRHWQFCNWLIMNWVLKIYKFAMFLILIFVAFWSLCRDSHFNWWLSRRLHCLSNLIALIQLIFIVTPLSASVTCHIDYIFFLLRRSLQYWMGFHCWCLQQSWQSCVDLVLVYEKPLGRIDCHGVDLLSLKSSLYQYLLAQRNISSYLYFVVFLILIFLVLEEVMNLRPNSVIIIGSKAFSYQEYRITFKQQLNWLRY